jgi:predicted nucleotidyltransferase
MSHGIDEESKQKIIAILAALFPNAEIYLFGSRARGTQSQWSDIDIALKEDKKISRSAIGEVISMFENSCIPYKIQIVDFSAVSEAMRESITSEGILWKK